MSARQALLALLLVVGCVSLLSCGSHSPLTVEITIPVTSSDLATGTDTTPTGFVQGYVFTPTTSGGGAPLISQSPKPLAGYEVTSSSVVVSIPSVSGTTTRLDQGGFFAFRGFSGSAPPVNVMVEFPGGGYPSFTSEVPVVPRDVSGFAYQQIDLDQNTQYRNNARDIRGMSGCRMNFTINASAAGRFRLYAAARGDLATDDLLIGEDAYLLLDWDMLAGESRSISDQRPFDEQGLLDLATPSEGNRMFHLYLVTQTKTTPAEAIGGSITGLTLVFRARVSAPL
jgi:hypothetical protein